MKKRGSTLTKPKRRSAPKVARRRKLSAADANEKTALLTRELSESLEQQTATSDILRAIAAAPGDADGTLRKIAETTARLFGAVGVSFRVAEGDEFKLSVGVGQGAEQIGTKLFDDPTKRPKVHGRNLPGSVVRENRQINIPDLDHLDHEQAEWPGLAVARSAGIRTMVGTPLRTEGRAIGALMVYRNVLQPFDLAELQLQQSFADQAVIAIENARLINETREALEQQKASGEVLSVISGSVADASPVFDRILDGCERLVAFERAAIFLVDAEDQVQLATARGQRGESVTRALHAMFPQPLARTPMHRAFSEGRVVIFTDVANDADAPWTLRTAATKIGSFSVVVAPMLWEGRGIGAIHLSRAAHATFTEKEVALLKTFADQAVIAIQNARLFNETKEALEQQTATSEVLQVISSSPGDLQPVFATMLENAVRICDAKFGNIHRWDGGAMHLVATHNTPPGFAEFRRRSPIRSKPKNVVGRTIATKAAVHVADLAAEQAYIKQRDPGYVAAVELGGVRTFLTVPMLKENDLIGLFTLYRQEVRPFTDKQIALVTNFASQAVIAIENARLLSELRESLQQQTATADVLKVISRSTFDLQTVLNTLTESATRLCEADKGAIMMRDGDLYRIRANYGFADEAVQYALNNPLQPGRSSATGRAALEGKAIHIPDVLADPEYRATGYHKAFGYRSMLAIPLLREETTIGTFTLTRDEVNPFTEKQKEIATTFADQAVIAIENARLLSELRESLQQQTATADVLRVISSSPGELEPVFDAMLEKAVRICHAKFGTLYLLEADAFRAVATHNAPTPYIEDRKRNLVRPPPDSALGGVLKTHRVTHLADITAVQSYIEGDPYLVSAVKLGGYRSVAAIPMLKDNSLIGAITINRQEVQPFTDKQIEILQNFASQAVIAIENTRLLNELRQRTADLTESLEQQTATSEVLRVISSSPGELEPVFEAMLQNAVRICGAKFGNLFVYEGEFFRIGATHGAPHAYVEYLRREGPFRADPRLGLGRLAQTKQSYQVADIAAQPTHKDKLRVATIELAGARTVLGVPMLKDGEVVGSIVIYRRQVQPFTDKQIELVQNFAAQAVIAIENTRLLSELRKSLQQQTATADVLKVISRSTFDLQTVLDTLTEFGRTALRGRQGHHLPARWGLVSAGGKLRVFARTGAIRGRTPAPAGPRQHDWSRRVGGPRHSCGGRAGRSRIPRGRLSGIWIQNCPRRAAPA